MTDWLDTLSLAMMKMSPDFHVSAHCLTQEVILTEMKFNLSVFMGANTHSNTSRACHTVLGFQSWQRGGVRQETIQDKDECSKL